MVCDTSRHIYANCRLVLVGCECDRRELLSTLLVCLTINVRASTLFSSSSVVVVVIVARISPTAIQFATADGAKVVCRVYVRAISVRQANRCTWNLKRTIISGYGMYHCTYTVSVILKSESFGMRNWTSAVITSISLDADVASIVQCPQLTIHACKMMKSFCLAHALTRESIL